MTTHLDDPDTGSLRPVLCGGSGFLDSGIS
jgi:hypothetical protein